MVKLFTNYLVKIISGSTVTRLYVGCHDQCRPSFLPSFRLFLGHQPWDSVQIRWFVDSQISLSCWFTRNLADLTMGHHFAPWQLSPAAFRDCQSNELLPAHDLWALSENEIKKNRESGKFSSISLICFPACGLSTVSELSIVKNIHHSHS